MEIYGDVVMQYGTKLVTEQHLNQNFGMIFWQKPNVSDAILFLAEKNCTTVSHEIIHEMLRIKGNKKYIHEVHDVWTKHFYEQLEFQQYGEDFESTEGKPMFLTMDISKFKN